MAKPYTGAGRKQSPPWSLEEDRVLADFAALLRPWDMLKGMIPGRSVASCQTRWSTLQHIGDLKRKIRNANKAKEQYIPADGPAIYGGDYIFRVPEGDPYLQRLIEIHGKDTINRNFAGATK